MMMRFNALCMALFAVGLPLSALAQDATELDAVRVTGYRASLERSQQVKRSANAIVDAISAEDIGKFPDINAAESLSHLPGISVDRQFGEGEKVSINGTDPALNRVLLNGQTIASGDWGGNPTDFSGRVFNYTMLSPEIIGLMEVYKSPQARIDEGSIGGTVIVHTRKPLDLPANTLRGSIGYQYNDRSGEGNPRGSVLWSWKNTADTFGALVSLTHDRQDIARAGIEFFGYTTGAAIPDSAEISGDAANVATALVPAGINSSWFQQVRERDGIQAAAQWHVDEHNEFNLTGVYIKGRYHNFSQSRYICPNCGDIGKITRATVGNGYVTSARIDVIDGQPYAQLDTNYRMSDLTTGSLNLRHDWTGDVWTFTSQAGTTRATGGKNPEYLMKFLLQEGGYDFSYDGRNTSVNYDNADTNNWVLPALDREGNPNQAGGIYYSNSIDRERYVQFDTARDLDWGPLTQLQVGLKYMNHDNGVHSRGNRLFATADARLVDFNPTAIPNGLYDGLGASGDLTRWVAAKRGAVMDYLDSLPPDDYRVDYPTAFDVKEITRNLYAQLDFESGAWRGNIGVRHAQTRDKSLYWRSDDGGENFVRTQSTNRYDKPLPSFNLAYELDADKIIRFSAARVLARPRYADLAGSFSMDSRNSSNLTASGGNPDLAPYQSTNYDLAAEWFFAPSSMLSLEVFYRDISSYIVSVTTEQQLTDPITGVGGIYQVTSPVNASNASVLGTSLNYQQAFALGFGMQANYTWSDDSSSGGLNLPYLSKTTYNVIPYWEHGDWMVRVNYSYRSRYFTQVGRLQSNIFTDSYKQLDVTASWKITDWMDISLSATNLLDSTYYWFNEVKYAPIGTYKNGRGYIAQVNFKF